MAFVAKQLAKEQVIHEKWLQADPQRRAHTAADGIHMHLHLLGGTG